MVQFPPIKRGDTFSPLLTYLAADGYPIPVTDIAISSQVRNANRELIANLTVSKLDQILYPGKYTLYATTATWPIGEELRVDIRYVQNGAVTHTETASFRVVLPETIE